MFKKTLISWLSLQDKPYDIKENIYLLWIPLNPPVDDVTRLVDEVRGRKNHLTNDQSFFSNKLFVIFFS